MQGKTKEHRKKEEEVNDYSKTEERQAGSQSSKQRNRETKTTREREGGGGERERQRDRETQRERQSGGSERVRERNRERGGRERDRDGKVACSVASLIERKQCQA